VSAALQRSNGAELGTFRAELGISRAELGTDRALRCKGRMALETAAAGQLPSPPDSTQHSHCGQAIRDPEVSYRGLLLLTAAKFLFILFPPVVCGASGRVLSEVTKLRDRRFGTPDAGAGPRPDTAPGRPGAGKLEARYRGPGTHR
jgi:hypothetical protein